MYCGNCGTQFEGKFCPHCGTPAPAAREPASDAGFTQQEQPYDPSVYELPETEPKKPKKRGKLLAVILGVIAGIAVIAAAVVLLGGLLPRPGGGNACVYLNRGKYQMITDIKKGEAVQFGSARSDIVNEQLLAFTEDGKYIYYYTKVDDSTYTGTLCRAEYGKFKKDVDKNEKYIETIANNVRIGFRLLESGGVLYQNDSGKLYYYDGKESVQIGRDVNSYYSQGADWLFYGKGEYGDMTLYGVDLKTPEDSVKLDKGIAYIMYAENPDAVYYIKERTEGTYAQDLYVSGLNRETERIASDASVMTISDGAVYYVRPNGDSVSMYQFVTDDKAAEDSGITEPMISDYEVPNYVMNMIRESNPQESNYQGKELYTSCTQPLYWYGQGSGCSMQDAMNRTWNGNNDAIHTSTQAFIDKFGTTADANGFILVTDEVKAALKDINQYGSTASENTWLDMCYVKEQSGTTVDYNAYDAACQVYYAAADRIRLREELQNPENDLPLYTLERYQNGMAETVCDNVVFYSSNGGAMLVCTPDQITERKSIDTAYSTIDLQDSLRGMAEYSVVFGDSTAVYSMSDQAADTLYDTMQEGYANFYTDDGNAFLDDNHGEIFAVERDGSTITGLTSIDDEEAHVAGIRDGVLYYMKDLHSRDGNSYGDLYAFSGDKAVKLAQDVLNGGTRIYEDGVLEVVTDFQYYEDVEFEITLIAPDGEKTKLDDEISQVIRTGPSEYLFVSDGDLYRYDGKEKTRVQTNVDYIWTRTAEPYYEMSTGYNSPMYQEGY